MKVAEPSLISQEASRLERHGVTAAPIRPEMALHADRLLHPDERGREAGVDRQRRVDEDVSGAESRCAENVNVRAGRPVSIDRCLDGDEPPAGQGGQRVALGVPRRGVPVAGQKAGRRESRQRRGPRPSAPKQQQRHRGKAGDGGERLRGQRRQA